MLRRFTTLFLLLMPASCSVSCGGSEEGPGTETDDPYLTADGFCGEWAAAACNDKVVDACVPGSEDPGDCISAQEEYCNDHVSSSGYNGTKAEECVKAVEAAFEDAKLTGEERDLVTKLTSPCNLIVGGARDEGGKCEKTSNCDTSAELVCLIPLGKSEGTCQKPEKAERGQECDKAFLVCEEGTYCRDGYCVVTGSAGKACSAKAPCGADLKCDVDPDAKPAKSDADGGGGDADSKICVEQLDVGDDCDSDDDCKTGVCSGREGAKACAKTTTLTEFSEICDNLH